MKKSFINYIFITFIFLGKFFFGATEKEMNILDLDQDEKTGLVYIKDSKKLFTGIGKTYYESGKLETICRFKDGIGLRTAHIRCSINGVEYKDWEAIDAIYK